MTSQSRLDWIIRDTRPVLFYDRDGLLDLFLTNVGLYTQHLKGPGGYWIGFKDAFRGHLKPNRTERSILLLYNKYGYSRDGGNDRAGFDGERTAGFYYGTTRCSFDCL